MQTTNYTGVNWNTPENDYVQMFWEQNIKQFWIDTEYLPSSDIASWNSLDPVMKQTYMRALGGLTLLDTMQSNVGMPKIIDHIPGLQCKAVLGFMCMMESIHAKSYSTIFTTVANKEEIEEIFSWIQIQPQLQYKAAVIDSYYQKLTNEDLDDYDIYMALVASVMLESFLFYSGFFLPLYLSGNGKMTASADIIKKIVQDESIHGVFVGLLAQEKFQTLEPWLQEVARGQITELVTDLFTNESKYTDYLYTDIDLSSEVKEFLKYNANKALMNLGLEPMYTHEEINPIVLNGLNSETTQHDFFSKKSTNYEVALNIKPLHDEDFVMDFSSPI